MSCHTKGRFAVVVLLIAYALQGCGGGGGSSSPAPEPPSATPLPATVSITAPASGEAGASLQFGSSATASAGLSFDWRFGDGGTSVSASPQHGFDRAGSFEVVLRVSNEAGQSREARATVAVSSGGNVQGLVCSAGAGRGWCWQQQRPTAHRVRDVFAISPQVAWAVGQFGEILKTADGGAHWALQRAASEAGTLEAVTFLDAQIGWAVGTAGLFRTTDGGATWQRRDAGNTGFTNFYPEEVRVIDAQTAIVRSGYVGVTTRDGGATWRAVNPVEAISPAGSLYDSQFFRLNRADVEGLNRLPVLDLKAADVCGISTAVSFAGEAHVYLSVNASNCTPGPAEPPRVLRQTLWRSHDAGNSWAARDLSTSPGLFSQLLWASGSDGTLLAASGTGRLARSSDDGRSWVDLLNAPLPVGGPVLGLTAQSVVMFSGEQAHFSADAGLTWKASTLPQGRRFGSDRAVARRIDADSLTVRASNGDFWISRDRGASFQRLIGHTEVELNLQYSVAVLGAKKLRLLAFDRTMQESQDGGQTWNVLESGLGGLGSGPGVQKLQFVSAPVGWRLLTNGVIYRTDDGGVTWQPTPTYDAVGFYFADAAKGWARSQGQGLMLTDDGGRTWRKAGDLPTGITVLRHLANGRIVGVGLSDVTVVSTDNGQTWQRRAWPSAGASFLNALTAHPDGSLWAAGTAGVLLKSTDSGDSWVRVGLAADARVVFNDISFASASRGWIVGNGGLVYATADGGATWARQASGTPLDLHTVQASDASTAWITGAQGLLLATSTSGD